VDLGQHSVLVRQTSAAGSKEEQLLQCTPEIASMLQAMSFVCNKEVRWTENCSRYNWLCLLSMQLQAIGGSRHLHRVSGIQMMDPVEFYDACVSRGIGR
jgi:hypothetical protein